jgi:Fe-S-cluster containining protein
MGMVEVTEMELASTTSLKTDGTSFRAKRFLQTKSGICTHLVSGNCAVYNERPTGCRDYPWYRVGDDLFVDSGCPGVSAGHDNRPSTDSIKSLEEYFEVFPAWLSRIFVWLFCKW